MSSTPMPPSFESAVAAGMLDTHELPGKVVPDRYGSGQTSRRASRPARKLSFFHRRAFGWLTLLALVVVWEVLAAVHPSPGMPAPTRIATVWWEEVTQGALLTQLGDTLQSMAYGYGIAACLGITLGVLMARVRMVYALFEPLVEMIRPVPTIIFIPVIILYVGLGREMNVLAIVLSATEPILIAAFSGARAVSAALRDTAATFGLTSWQALREIVLPAAAPQIFVGLRLALASSLVLAIASGMIAGNSGIGFYILTAQQTLDIARMYAGALTVAAVGYALNFGFLALERRLLHWHAAHDRPATT